MSNGKGDTPRPFSVPQKTYASNWERAFGKKNDECAYSGLPSVSSYEAPPPEYITATSADNFFQMFPGLTGNWEKDKSRWNTLFK